MQSDSPRSIARALDLTGKVALITGGGGLLGPRHGEAIAEMGGIAVLGDVDLRRAQQAAEDIAKVYGVKTGAVRLDVTDQQGLVGVVDAVEQEYGAIDILINNAANDPKVGATAGQEFSRVENFSLKAWENDIAVGLTGAFICCQVIGSRMAARNRGVILNISSDLGIVAPDQRLYAKVGLPLDQQPVKPVTYSVVKHGIIGLTKYLATYWANQSVRVNALAPGGVMAAQSKEFLDRVNSRIPLGRLARPDEYKAAVAFLCSDASSYVTGAVLVADGGRTVW
ncbi:MAG TPA: SDR family oxidoreductase [Gemmatimonadaceae bacterium]|nr:SDR family oxidoreductase [Gemmatimonadaceae bacterium]